MAKLTRDPPSDILASVKSVASAASATIVLIHESGNFVTANLLCAFLIIYAHALTVGVSVQAHLPCVFVPKVIPSSVAAARPASLNCRLLEMERGERRDGERGDGERGGE
uniref:Uncharacterized protein n=1 Tax=Oryza meridionalis TaxID=40149 RepID=A0A0E0EFG2_9ORYZ